MRGADYRIDLTLDGASYAVGRNGGNSWRRTPNGFVRIVRSDVQGDPLDRWPRALFGFSGESDGEHSYSIDGSSGKLTRETDRDGSKTTTYDFTDDRHWTIHGFGGDAEVTVTSLQPAQVSESEVAIPPSAHALFALPASGVANIPTIFAYGYSLETSVQIDGQTRTFGIDTGTTQMLIDVGEAARLGLHPKFGHVMIPEIRAGDAVAHNVAAQTVDLFHGRFIAGLLGYEFFSGHIVHMDDRNSVVQLLDAAKFAPPKDARALPIDVREGMPLVQAGANGVTGSRFALDSGSYWIMLSSAFAHATGADRDRALKTSETMNFLEGPVYTTLREMPSFDFASMRFAPADAEVEDPNSASIDFHLDGIVGQNVLSAFEWWFDYDSGIAWMREI